MTLCTEEITAIEMAKDAEINQKAFRAALRREGLKWHIKGELWTVKRYSPEHEQMQSVLEKMQS